MQREPAQEPPFKQEHGTGGVVEGRHGVDGGVPKRRDNLRMHLKSWSGGVFFVCVFSASRQIIQNLRTPEREREKERPICCQ